jgi:hypothetical protein
MAEVEWSLNLLNGLTFAPSGAIANFTNVTVIGLTVTGPSTFYYQNAINQTVPDTTSFYLNTSSSVLSPISNNTVIGVGAGNNIVYTPTGGFTNTILGYNAGFSLSSGILNAFIGTSAGLNDTSASETAAIGSFAGAGITTGNGNTAIGYQSGLLTTTGTFNTFLGYQSGALNNVTGNFNTCLGALSNVGSDGLVGATAVGANATVLTSNTFQLGQAGTDNVNIGNELFVISFNPSPYVVQFTDANGHIVSSTPTPTIVAGLGAGSPATISVSGSAISGTILLTTGNTVNPTASAIIAKIMFTAFNGYATPLHIILTPGNANAASLTVTLAPYATSSSEGSFILSSNTTALSPGVTYQWYYQITS